MTAVQHSSRRAQRRVETVGEIKARAMEQITAGGVEQLSLNAVARSMSMAPAALYRYFPSKDALLADLVVEAYDSLAGALERAAAAEPPGAARLAAVVRAYRTWALGQPNAYLLVFQQPSGNGEQLAPERTLPAAVRSMDVFLGALAELPPPGDLALDATLSQQIARWGGRTRIPDSPVDTLALGLICWTRLHGLISLELNRHLAATGIDPERLYEHEVQALLSLATTDSNRPSVGL